MPPEAVTFYSEGTPVAAHLRLPCGAPKGGVVFCAGMSLTKEVWLPAFAEALVEQGYATLNFDYRGFGESGGEPRRRMIPAAQVQDTRNALTYLESRPELAGKALGLFGVSMGCSVAVGAAAEDPRVAAFVAAAGPGHFERVWSAFPTYPAFKAKVDAARREFVRTGEVTYISVAKMLKSDPETCAKLEADVGDHPTWDLTVTYESFADVIAFNPEEQAHRIRAAALYAYPEADALIARFELSSLYAHTKSAHKRLLALEGARHVDVYATEGPHFATLCAAAQEWFDTHLAG